MWRTVKLGDILSLQNGYAFKSNEYEEDGYFVMRITNVQQGYISTHNPKYIRIDRGSKLEKFILQEDDILVSLTGDVGRVGVIKNEHLPAALNQRVARVTNVKQELVNSDFLFAYMNSDTFRLQVEDFAHGAAQANVSTKDILSINLSLPSLAEQKRIVAKLDAAFAEIDKALISINHKYILAEQLVSRVISSVFSQIPDSELQHATLGEVTYTAGRIGWKGLTKKEYVEEGRLFLSVHGLNYGKFVDFRDAFRITQARYDESPEIMLKQGDILLCKDGAGIGKLGVVGKLPEPATINSSLLLIRPSEQLTTDYIYYSLLSSEFQSVIQSKIDGATTPHLYQRDIHQFQFSVPSLQIQMEITEKISTASSEIKKIQNSLADNRKNYKSLKSAILAEELKSEAA